MFPTIPTPITPVDAVYATTASAPLMEQAHRRQRRADLFQQLADVATRFFEEATSDDMRRVLAECDAHRGEEPYDLLGKAMRHVIALGIMPAFAEIAELGERCEIAGDDA